MTFGAKIKVPGRRSADSALLFVKMSESKRRFRDSSSASVGRFVAGWRPYFGASTITIWRPSINGSASTLAIGAVSVFTRWSSRKPMS
jgi:hypothetical protein